MLSHCSSCLHDRHKGTAPHPPPWVHVALTNTCWAIVVAAFLTGTKVLLPILPLSTCCPYQHMLSHCSSCLPDRHKGTAPHPPPCRSGSLPPWGTWRTHTARNPGLQHNHTLTMDDNNRQKWGALNGPLFTISHKDSKSHCTCKDGCIPTIINQVQVYGRTNTTPNMRYTKNYGQ